MHPVSLKFLLGALFVATFLRLQCSAQRPDYYAGTNEELLVIKAITDEPLEPNRHLFTCTVTNMFDRPIYYWGFEPGSVDLAWALRGPRGLEFSSMTGWCSTGIGLWMLPPRKSVDSMTLLIDPAFPQIAFHYSFRNDFGCNLGYHHVLIDNPHWSKAAERAARKRPARTQRLDSTPQAPDQFLRRYVYPSEIEQELTQSREGAKEV